MAAAGAHPRQQGSPAYLVEWHTATRFALPAHRADKLLHFFFEWNVSRRPPDVYG